MTAASAPSLSLRSALPVLLRGVSVCLVATVWTSSLIFGVFILAFYASPLAGGDLTAWNRVLPDIYTEGRPAATWGIGLHFAAGGLILILGSVQLLGRLRQLYPRIHRWLGRIYVLACLLASVGGLTFILTTGTVGGPVMSVGFGLYGALMFVSAVHTYRFARARQWESHTLWSWRLYALAIGSWLYRMDYGFWLAMTDGVGHTSAFRGWFDAFMSFFFYLPNLLIVEVLFRTRRPTLSPQLQSLGVLTLALVTSFVAFGTYVFTRRFWGPAILDWLGFT